MLECDEIAADSRVAKQAGSLGLGVSREQQPQDA
jgi:hypothetical protein